MTREEFEDIKEFAGRLAELRHQVADGQLLDRCETALRDLIEHAQLNFEDFPNEMEAVAAEPPHYVEPPRAESEPEPPPPPPSEPPSHVRHTAAHKRPTPRKTRR